MAAERSPLRGMNLSESASNHQLPVLIVEPVEVVRAGLRGLLERAPDMTVVGEAASGEEAVRQARESSPAVALVGLDPLGPDGVRCIRDIANGGRPVGVIVVGAVTSVDALAAALQAGAQGYISREVGGELLLEAVRVVGQGGAIVDPVVTGELIAYLGRDHAREAVSQRVGGMSPFDTLSQREGQVLRALASGLSNKEIAMSLGVRIGTVKTHVHHIFRKLGVSDRTSAALAAVRFSDRPATPLEDRH
jgi:DNA-binding NarL/FixJ family response regulator